MEEGKSTVRVARKNLRMTHSTNLPEGDIITFCIYSNEYIYIYIYIYIAEDTLTTAQRYYTRIKLNYVSLHYFYNYKNDVHLFW
jgi:hypothetical protein